MLIDPCVAQAQGFTQASALQFAINYVMSMGVRIVDQLVSNGGEQDILRNLRKLQKGVQPDKRGARIKGHPDLPQTTLPGSAIGDVNLVGPWDIGKVPVPDVLQIECRIAPVRFSTDCGKR